MFKFFILALFLLNFEAESAQDLLQLQESRQFLAKKLSHETKQKADEIRLEGLRVIKKLKSFNFSERLPFLEIFGYRLQARLDNDPTLAKIINTFEKPILYSDDLINIINITKVTSDTGVIIGGETQTDYDLILSYVRDAVTDLFPQGAKKIFGENPGENASTLVEFINIHIRRLQASLPKVPGKKKAAKAAFLAAKSKRTSDSLESTEERTTTKQNENATTEGIQGALIAAGITTANAQGGCFSETPEEGMYEENPLISLPSSASAVSTTEESTSLYNRLTEIVAKSRFFASWVSKKDIKKIDDLFDERILTDSSASYNLLKNLVKKQCDAEYKAEFREGSGSHKLAALVSESGRKVLFPFAHHAGTNLDGHSRDMIIDGFKELFGIPA